MKAKESMVLNLLGSPGIWIVSLLSFAYCAKKLLYGLGGVKEFHINPNIIKIIDTIIIIIEYTFFSY